MRIGFGLGGSELDIEVELMTAGWCLKEEIQSDVKHIVITSSSTVSQNRNQYVTAKLLLAAQILPNVGSIKQNFLEPGHKQKEVDSTHSIIDYAQKNIKVNEPSEWPMIIQMAH